MGKLCERCDCKFSHSKQTVRRIRRLHSILCATRSQFHQHLMHVCIVRNCFAQLFSSYILTLSKGLWQKKHFHAKNERVKCWWNCHWRSQFQQPFSYKSALHSFSLITVWLCIFWWKNIGSKAARKMFMKLTTHLNFTSHTFNKKTRPKKS